MKVMTAHEHFHGEVTQEWPKMCHDLNCDVWPRVIDLEISATGAQSYSVVQTKQDFIARRLNESQAVLMWSLLSQDVNYLKEQAERAYHLMLSTYPFLVPILYPEA